METSVPDHFRQVSKEEFRRVIGQYSVVRDGWANGIIYRATGTDRATAGYEMDDGTFWLNPCLCFHNTQ